MRRTLAFIGVSALFVGTALIGGCSSASSQRAGVLLNPSPNVGSMNQREDDMINASTHANDTNWRSFRQDLGRAFLTDRPSRLNWEPMR